MKELEYLIDEDWVYENPDSANELIHALFDELKHYKAYISTLEEKYEFVKENNLLAHAIIKGLRVEAGYEDLEEEV